MDRTNLQFGLLEWYNYCCRSIDLNVWIWKMSSWVRLGDVTHVLAKLFQTLKLLKSKFREVYFCPGNHDLWTKSQQEDEHLNIYDSIDKFHYVRLVQGIIEVIHFLRLDYENLRRNWCTYETRYHCTRSENNPFVCLVNSTETSLFISMEIFLVGMTIVYISQWKV